MAYTVIGSVMAVMQATFDSTTAPTDTQVTAVIIPMADSMVDADNLSGASAADKLWMSTLMSAHLIEAAKDIDFRSADVNISAKRVVTHYLNLYNMMANNRRNSFFEVVNQ